MIAKVMDKLSKLKKRGQEKKQLFTHALIKILCA